MKTIIFTTIIALVAANCGYYDLPELDVNESINNSLELKKFVDCVLCTGECSQIYEIYRDVTAEAVEQACKKCSPYQKHVYWLFLRAMEATLPIEYINYKHKYDPDNIYFDTLESELLKYSC